jgi:hypothetical protein
MRRVRLAVLAILVACSAPAFQNRATLSAPVLGLSAALTLASCRQSAPGRQSNALERLALGVSTGVLKTDQNPSVSSSRSGYISSSRSAGYDLSASSPTPVATHRALFIGRRDPFRLPPPPSAAKKKGLLVYLPPGVPGLLIDQLTLKGVLRENAGQTAIAIVTNKTERAYFLRLNEHVYDGVVTRITPEAIYFRKRVLSSQGETTFRSVVKQLNGPEGRPR